MKIYEAMAMGKAVVSTSVGAEGLPLTDSEHILFADDEKNFAAKVLRLLSDKKERKRLGDNARNYVYQHFRWEQVANVFADICEQTIQKYKTRSKGA